MKLDVAYTILGIVAVMFAFDDMISVSVGV